jgi:3'(2'), 5'-bisphosphate nucleotidase
MSQPLDPDTRLLEALIAAAVEAGRVIHDIYHRGFEVEQKADATPVTDADRAAEAIILRHLSVAAPGVPIVAEEEVAAGRAPAVGGEFFLVDPLDGTREFVQRRGDFTVNIALTRAGVPALGVVYAPASSQLFAGIASTRNAFKSHQQATAEAMAARVPIRVRHAPHGGLTVVASRSHSTPETDSYLAQYVVAERVAVGSSLKFCLVASGAADLYPRLGPTMEWDTAAGHAVLLAAGGSVSAPQGVPLTYGKPGFRNPSFIASGTLVPVPLAA